jgi:D-alanyl-lipoteichoic acid acyltransferase DltB (MBOAT superfamily)
MPELIKLLPDGSAVVSVIVVVLLFLKQQREQEKRLDSITIGFNARILEVTSAYQAQIDKLANQIFQDKANTQQQMLKLFDSFMAISKETVSALVELRGAVEMLTKRVDSFGREKKT